VEAAGIAPAIVMTQSVSQKDCCVEGSPACLHTVCTDVALRELVARWHGLAPSVRAEIIGLMGGLGLELRASQQAP